LNEVLDGFVSGVWMYFERGCESANGREGLTRLKLATDECLLGGENYLIDNRFAGS
jgi:hypothetical protein